MRKRTSLLLTLAWLLLQTWAGKCVGQQTLAQADSAESGFRAPIHPTKLGGIGPSSSRDSSSWDGRNRWTAQIGYSSQRRASTGVTTDGLLAGVTYGKGEYGIHFGPGVGIEYLPKRGVLAPKFWYEVEFIYVTGRLDVGYYRYQASTDLRLTPQIGLSLFGWLNAYYGYQVPLTHQELYFLARHRFAFTFNALRVSTVF